ncbi:Sodium-coupled monocarboxylate transporter 1 [Eumeta japonica]|uniref:Sodium-coupled monocarboxylate transporter 1 n=1 Tax=Eumeta variegata TaxID=151549 RepID=A0A4C1TIG0_EUMVA|nr:Sodium-coupled monocarboxylate transporter 1 [Eumeta japonica]
MWDVSEVRKYHQQFLWIDYLVFVVMLAICGCVGIYFGFVKKQKSAQQYLMGGRNMSLMPVTFSLVASFISGISLLGMPTEVYVYGTSYFFVLIGALCMTIITSYTFLPLFYELRLTSAYEYLELRFDKRVRVFGSVLFMLSLMAWLPIVIYVPALAFNQVTGVNIHIVTPLVCFVCIFYTSMGGLKAVVWTDVIQTISMFGAMIVVLVKTTLMVGGLGEVMKNNWATGRLEAPSLKFDFTERYSIWALTIGATVYYTGQVPVSQAMMQRFLALPDLRTSKKALWGFFGGLVFTSLICVYSGIVVYARYHDCDPLDSNLAVARDQLLPLLVMDVLKEWPGIPGLFVAGIFSAALSSLSTGLNSMAAVVLEDFYKPFFKELSTFHTQILVRSVVVVMGVLCVALVFVVEQLGSVLQLTISFSSATGGAQLAIFVMGIFLPFIDSTSSLCGGVAGLAATWWVAAHAQLAQARGALKFAEKPRYVYNCTYTFVASVPTETSLEKKYHYSIIYPTCGTWPSVVAWRSPRLLFSV